MKCSICGNSLSVNSKGQISCAQCSSVSRKLTVVKFMYGALEAYRVIKAINVVTDEFLLPEEVEQFIKQGVVINIK